MSAANRSLHVCASRQELVSALGQYVRKHVEAAVADHGRFTVALSGGSLPTILGEALTQASADGKDSWHWDKWVVGFADERIVPLDSSDSNFRTCKEALFDKVGISDDQVIVINPTLDAHECAQDYEARLRQHVGSPTSNDSISFDLVLLGMGPDGHTCSLFPNHSLLSERGRMVASLTDSPKPPPSRVTLTFPALESARAIGFVCTGAGKAEAIETVFRGDDANPQLPAQMVVKPAPTWFIDQAAAANLKGTE